MSDAVARAREQWAKARNVGATPAATSTTPAAPLPLPPMADPLGLPPMADPLGLPPMATPSAMPLPVPEPVAVPVSVTTTATAPKPSPVSSTPTPAASKAEDPHASEKAQYEIEKKKTILVTNINPKTTKEQLIALFNCPHGVREVKWYHKLNTNNALVEFNEAGEGPQGLTIENLIQVDGNWLNTAPSTICIREANKLEVDIEQRKAREAVRRLKEAQATPSAVVEDMEMWKARAKKAEEELEHKDKIIAFLKGKLGMPLEEEVKLPEETKETAAAAAEPEPSAFSLLFPQLALPLPPLPMSKEPVPVPLEAPLPAPIPIPLPIATTTTTPSDKPSAFALIAHKTMALLAVKSELEALANKWRTVMAQKVTEMEVTPAMQKLQEERERKSLVKTYMCPICFSEVPLAQMYVLDLCFHRFCLACIRDYMNTNITEGATALKCPEPSCTCHITPSEVKQLMDRSTYLKYEDFSLKAALAAIPDVRWCPKANCGNAMIISGGLSAKCLNPKCRFMFCIKCRDEWHPDISCEMYQKWKLENNEADSRFAEWASSHSKPCPKCNAGIEKNGGCNHMTCKGCGHQFCWLCMGDYDGNHFSTGPCAGKQFTDS
ncbi:E3 ubiquitin-protein ligase RNF19A [Pelomyxa schiedti]|nr:E3 ubiquitin-protein ligase RNF19A [Pelomyxa schiedti]